jgi:hypothetical protein
MNYLWYIYNATQGCIRDKTATAVDTALFRPWLVTHLPHIQQAYADKLSTPYQQRLCDLDALLPGASVSVPESLRLFLEAIKRAFDTRELPQPPLNAFKTTETDSLERYHALFPDMRFVHIIRNPITNYASVKRTNLEHGNFLRIYRRVDDLSVFLERWTHHAAFLRRHVAAGSERDLVIRYEDLCAAPEETVAAVCRWLGIEPPAEPSLQTTLGGRAMRTLPVPPSKKGVATPARVVGDMAATYAYNTILSRDEEDFIALKAGPLAEAFGYALPTPPADPVKRALWGLRLLCPDRSEFRYLRPGRSIFILAANMMKRRRYILSNLFGGAPATAEHGQTT